MIPVEQALETILSSLDPLGTERVSLLEALGRVLAEPISAKEVLPPFDNSAMDGFALKVADVRVASPEHPVELVVAGEVAAGSYSEVPLAAGTAVRIMTGAPTPPGTEAIVKVEDTEPRGDRVLIKTPAELGEFIRRAGEDVRQGQVVLDAGLTMTPARIQMAAAVGCPELTVRRLPRVAILATGDELVEVGDPLRPGQIRNSNAYGLHAAVIAAGAMPVMLGVARDTREDTEAKIRAGLSQADVIISSGGVSMGEYDYVSEVLEQLGKVHFTAVAQQPGKPFTYATLEGKPYFGLPGNPVSTMVCFELYVRPALRRLMGHADVKRPRARAVLAEATRSPQGKRSFLRATLSSDGTGLVAHLTGPQGSGIIHSMVHANALVAIPEQTRSVEAGETVEVILIEQPEEAPCLS